MAEVLITVVQDSPLPLYRQIVDQIRFHIDSGALSDGDALPSVRHLATQLGVHFNTVADAYRELAQEGWIVLAPGKRAMVRTCHLRPAPGREQTEHLLQRLRNLVAELRLKGLSTRAIEIEVKAILQR